MIIHDNDGDDGDDAVSYHNDLHPQPFRLSEERFNNRCNYKMV